MAHEFIISIPTTEEIKEKSSAFWNKHKKTIVIGGVVAGTATLAAYLNINSDDEQISIEPADDTPEHDEIPEPTLEMLNTLDETARESGFEIQSVTMKESPIEEATE